MAKILQLTGLSSFASPRTYGVALMLGRTIKVRDEDGAALLLLTVVNSSNTVVPVFTDLPAALTSDYDVSGRYHPQGLVEYDPMSRALVRGEEKVQDVLTQGQTSALEVGGALSTAPLVRGPTPYTTPTQAGTNGAISFGGKRRVMDWAGTPGQYAYRAGAMHISDVQFGTRTADTPSNTSFSAYVTDIETGGTQPALFTPAMVGGTMSIAGGRFRQSADGAIRLMHYADDALYSNSPRFQLVSFPLPNKQRIVHEFIVQFGDDETPYPAYVAGKQNNLFWQIKGPTGQPPLAINCERQSDGSLKFYVNRKKTNASGIYTAGTSAGHQVNTPISFRVEFSLDWQTYDEGGTAYFSVAVGGNYLQLFDESGNADGMVSVCSPSVFTDVSQVYQWIGGIYRYDYAGVKAPNNCAVTFRRHQMFAA